MDWSRMKTIFIVVFFALDLFLAYEMLSLRESSQLETRQVETVEQKLKEANIHYEELPGGQIKESKITCEPEKIDIGAFQGYENVQFADISDTEISGVLKKPFMIGEDFSETKLAEFLQVEVPFSGQYRFSRYDPTQRALIFNQIFEGRKLFMNTRGQVLAFLNDNFEVTSYRLTKLGKVERFGNKKDLIPAIKAIEKLFDKDKIVEGSKITKVELGYFTLFQTSYQALEPTWRFVVNEESVYFVTAIEGNIHELDDTIKEMQLSTQREAIEFKIERSEINP